MLLGHLPHHRQKLAGHQRDGETSLGRCWPNPVHGSVRGPGFLAGLQEGEPESKHSRSFAPTVYQGLALWIVQRKLAQNGQTVWVLLCFLQCDVAGAGVLTGWVNNGSVHTSLVHLLQQVFG